jgi:hypothetical protein
MMLRVGIPQVTVIESQWRCQTDRRQFLANSSVRCVQPVEHTDIGGWVDKYIREAAECQSAAVD